MERKHRSEDLSRSDGAWQSLRRHFPHHKYFRDGQKQVIERLLAGENAAAIFPTGGGKSLCYQLPGLVLSSLGMTLVISPLLALMKDQVDSMRQKGHNVDLLGSSLSLDEKIAVQNRVRHRETSILYVAPEQLNNEKSVALIRSVPIALMAIDEAHCISEWGNAFRPDYLRLAKLTKEWKVKRVVALTATATPKVAKDICEGFAIPPENCFRTAFFRPNLKLSFTKVASDKARDQTLISCLQSNPAGSTIVYATTQKTTEKVADLLKKAGMDARPYHAGLQQDIRKATQEWFMEDNSARIVCATIAFGMGVDKRDIRYVYHYNLPKSLESYAQEIGRAGRDGKDSICHVLCRLEDVAQLESFAYCGSPSRSSIEGVLREVFYGQSERSFPVGTERAISQFSIARGNDMPQNTIHMLLAFLEIHHGFLKPRTPRYGMYKIKPRGGGSAATVMSFFRQCDDSRAADVLSAICVPKQKWAHIDMNAAITRFPGTSRDSLVTALARLEVNNLIEIMPSQVEHVYLIEQVPSSLQELAKTEYDRFRAREKKELARIGEVLAFLSADDCQAMILTEHFEGSDGPSQEGASSKPFPCGHCPRCKTGTALDLPKPASFSIDPELWRLLKDNANLPRDDPHLIARFALGFTSPRIQKLRLGSDQQFGLFAGTPFNDLFSHILSELFPEGYDN